MKKTIPDFDPKTMVNNSPHVVILGAGASRAACPNGDKNNKIVPLMNELTDILDLKEIINSLKLESELYDFESIYNEIAINKIDDKILNEIESRTYRYFNNLSLPNKPTIYDYLILSLRDKDVIATFNWDPFLFQAYRRNLIIGHMPEILFLHGNVKVGICYEHRNKGFTDQACNECNKPFAPTKLLYPVKEKNYNQDPFIKQEWAILQTYLEHAYHVTIFGYGAPETDIEAKELMLNVWQKNTTRDLANFGIIDIKNQEELEKLWHPFINDLHYGIINSFHDSTLFYHPRRTCDSLAMANLQQAPWHTNKYPEFESIEQLQNWITPLIEEEKENKFSGNPCK